MTTEKRIDDWNPSTAQRKVRDAVAEIFDVPPHALVGRGRRRPLVDYRHIGMWIIRECFPALSYPMIGRLFGGRDHSTVIHGVRKVEDQRGRDTKFRELTDTIRDSFGVQRAGIEMDQDVRLRIAAVAARVEQERDIAARPPVRPHPQPEPPAPVRAIKPKNDFAEDDSDGRLRSRASDALGKAIEREGLTCR